MMKHGKNIFLAAALAGTISAAPAQQLSTPAPSPLQTVTQAFGLGELKIEYSRPGVKGRLIYGGLVPFGKIWRTGANAATKITVGDQLRMAGKEVKAGTYAMYTIPGREEWQVMLYNDLKLGGDVANYNQENEYMRFSIKPKKMTDKLETFTIAVNNMTSGTCTIDLMWENTIVSVPVESMHDAEVMKQIAATMPDTVDNRPYFRAAMYYFDNGKDLDQALKWVNKAIEQNPDAFFMIHVKAKMLAKKKDYKAAIETANLSKAKAIEKKNDDYVSLNENLVAEIKKESGMK